MCCGREFIQQYVGLDASDSLQMEALLTSVATVTFRPRSGVTYGSRTLC
jgi:hypothetical protein